MSLLIMMFLLGFLIIEIINITVFKIICKYYISDNNYNPIGVIPRWAKLHKYIEKNYKQ